MENLSVPFPKDAKKIVIVLANLMDQAGNLNEESIGRARAGAEFFLKNNCDLIVTCGWPYRSDTPIFISDALKKYIGDHFPISREKIYSEKRPRDTVGDAVFTKLDVSLLKHIPEIIVATSDYHSDRTEQIFKFIYGSAYKVKVIQAETSYKKDKMSDEAKSLAAFQKTFAGITAGDDRNILDRLIQQHPFYNGEVYPQIGAQDV